MSRVQKVKRFTVLAMIFCLVLNLIAPSLYAAPNTNSEAILSISLQDEDGNDLVGYPVTITEPDSQTWLGEVYYTNDLGKIELNLDPGTYEVLPFDTAGCTNDNLQTNAYSYTISDAELKDDIITMNSTAIDVNILGNGSAIDSAIIEIIPKSIEGNEGSTSVLQNVIYDDECIYNDITKTLDISYYPTTSTIKNLPCGAYLLRITDGIDGYNDPGYIAFGIVNEQTGYKLYEIEHEGEDIKYTNEGMIIPVDNSNLVSGNTLTINLQSATSKAVEIQKVDADNNSALSATLEIRKDAVDGTFVKEVTTSPTNKTIETLEYGTYYLVEKSAPIGYTYADAIEFEVSETSDNVITMKDESTLVFVRAIASDTQEKMSDVECTVSSTEDARGDNTLTTDSDEDISLEQLMVDTVYTLKQDNEISGYEPAADISFKIDRNGDVYTLNATTGQYDVLVDDNVLVLNNTKETVLFDVFIEKYISGTTDLLAGAELAITKQGETTPIKTIVSVDSDNDEDKKVQLPAGTYVLSETKAPSGYAKAEPIEFTVAADGTISRTDNEQVIKKTIVMLDEKATPIKVSKQSIALTGEISGAKLKIVDNSGTTVEEWTSSATPHEISLVAGTYTLVEVEAPANYVKADDITFTIAADGTVTRTDNENVTDKTILMIDDYTTHNVEIEKIDADNGSFVIGAQLSVSNTDGAIDTWITTNATHTISVKPGTYTLSEILAPTGYDQADDITFVVATNGQLTVIGGEPNSTKVTMVDEKTKYEVFIEKYVLGTTDLLPGAELTVTDEDGNTIDSWTSTDAAHKLNVVAGTYTLTETSAPDGYAKAEPIEFTVAADGTISRTDNEKVIKRTIVMLDEPATPVTISKKDISGLNELAGATLEVKDASGQVIESWVSTTTPHKFGLFAGTYTLTETAAPNGYKIATDITFVVTDDNKVKEITAANPTGEEKQDGLIVMLDDYELFDVKIGKYIMGTTTLLPGATLVVTGNDITPIEFESTAQPKTLQLAFGTYTLTEKKAPVDFVTADPITFTVTKDGNVTINNQIVDENLVKMYDTRQTYPVTISKKVVAGSEELPGATLVITDSADNEIIKWVSTTTAKEVELPVGSYTLTETIAPEGFEIANSIDFTVGSQGVVTVNNQTVTEVVMYDEYKVYDVEIEKISATDDSFVIGAKLKVVNSTTSETVDSWDTTEATHKISVKPGTYTLSETAAPSGFEKADDITFTVALNGDVTILGETASVDKITMVDEEIKYEVFVEKYILGTTDLLPGAELTVTDEDGNTIDSWTSTDAAHKLNVVAGTYTLTETKAPKGYLVADPIKFTVATDGTISRTDNVRVIKETIVMFDEKAFTYDVAFSKQTVAGAELEGATLQLYFLDEKDAAGNPVLVEEWISTKTEHIVADLVPGNYRLVETIAPAGYVTAESIDFELKQDGTSDSRYVMVDDVTHVSILKRDKATSKPLAGAELVLKDANGKEVDRWVSTDKAHVIDALPVGTYTLIEETAPEGYKIAASISFTVEDTSTVKEVVMDDEIATPEEDITYTISVSKKNIETKAELPGAVLRLTDANGNIVATWTSGTQSHIIEDLPAGVYTLSEVTPPAGYAKADNIQIVLKEDGSSALDYVMYDDYIKLDISKQDITSKTELPGAKLKLTDKSGKVIDEWTSTDKPHRINMIPAGRYILTETTAPNGYLVAESIEFEVTATGKIQKVTMYDDYTKVQISKQDITTKKELPGAKLKLTDANDTVIAEWTSTDKPYQIDKLAVGTYKLIEVTAPEGYAVAETITFEVKATGEIQTVVMYDEAIKTDSPQTGDDTNNRLEILLLSLSSVLIVGCVATAIARKKDEEDEENKSNEK